MEGNSYSRQGQMGSEKGRILMAGMKRTIEDHEVVLHPLHAPVQRDALETSREAAKAVKVTKQTREVLLALLKEPAGLTDAQLSEVTGLVRARTRRKYLLDAGRVWWTGTWVHQPNGRRARVWTAYEGRGVPSTPVKKKKRCSNCGFPQ